MIHRDFTAAMLDTGPQAFLTVDLGYEMGVSCKVVMVLYPQKLHVYCDLCMLTETHARLPRLMPYDACTCVADMLASEL